MKGVLTVCGQKEPPTYQQYPGPDNQQLQFCFYKHRMLLLKVCKDGRAPAILLRRGFNGLAKWFPNLEREV